MNGYDQSIADVLRSTIHDAQELVRGEIALARAEMREEVARLRGSAMAFAGAALSAVIAVIFLLTALAWAIPVAFAWPAWSGFAIVGGLVLIAAVVLGVMGRNRLNGHRHMPHTLDTMKENMQWMRARTS